MKIIRAAFVVVALAAVCNAQDDTARFRYRAARAFPVGTVLHYVKTNIDGTGLRNRGGLIWVNKKHGWVEDMEIALPDNPDWTSFKFKFLRVERMSRAKWEKFVEEQL